MRVARAAAIAGCAGLASMGLELTAVRVLAPHFGDSAYVWTNVIGVILAALAAGAFCGGRLADRGRGPRALPLLCGGAAVLVALVPLLAGPLGSALLPQDLPLDAAMPALVRGSLAATAALFGLPVFLLGAVAPILVAMVAQRVENVGSAVGAISAAGTFGSLVGTFAATHWLVPVCGCRTTLWLCAAVLALCALLARAGRLPLAMAAVVALSWLLHGGPLRAPTPGQELLAEVESAYQYLQVVRDPANPGGALTALKINEGLDSFHSVAIAGSAFTGGRYYDWHALAPLLAGDGVRPSPLAVLSIGDAAGSIRRIYAAVHPGATVDAVELDAATVSLGDRFFAALPAPGRVFAGLDGRVFAAHATAHYAVIHVDAYAHQVYIPAHLASCEFFLALQGQLIDGGVLALNVGGLRLHDAVLQAIGNTLLSVFGNAAALHVPDSRNFLVVARKGRPPDATLLQHFAPGVERLSPADAAHWARLIAAAAAPGAFRRLEADAALPLLGDDRPVLDLLLQRSYFDASDDAAPVAIAGGRTVADAEAAAHAALQAGDPEAALAAAQQSRSATAYLRWLCGDARWRLRQLHGAKAEYAAGLAGEPGDLAATLQQRLQALADDLAPHAEAERLAGRNAWWAATAILLLVAAAASLCGACSRGTAPRRVAPG
jgi:spermidine synthase